MSPQNQIVLEVLRKRGCITALNALVNYGIARLAARIEELRKLGFIIVTEMRKVNRKRYASYRLVTSVQI